MSGAFLSSILALSFISLFSFDYPIADRESVSDTIFGETVSDPYRNLENADDSATVRWCDEEQALTDSFLDNLPVRKDLEERFDELWRYDEKGMPNLLSESDISFTWIKKRDLEKYYWVMSSPSSNEERILVNPNEMENDVDVDGVSMSRDGKYFAYGLASKGNEDARVRILKVESGELLKDTIKGRFQSVTSWLGNNDGFLYNAHPREGEAGYADSNYYQSVYVHRIGDDATEDRRIFFSDTLKEAFHYGFLSSNLKYSVFVRWYANASEIYLSDADSFKEMIPVAVGLDANYSVETFGDTLFIQSDKDAPMGMVYWADRKSPGRKEWRVFIKEDKKAKLRYVTVAGKNIFAVYEKDAMTEIRMYDSSLKFVRNISLPEKGSADVYGFLMRDEVFVWFSSFFFPPTTYRYFPEGDSLSVIKKSGVSVNTDEYKVEQVFYKSKDKTKVPMFILSRKDAVKNSDNPVMLTGYGGFNVSMNPYFNTLYAVWLEHGGIVAVPCLRGGGEYGEEWHRKGMKDKKQNVFDDFIYAAEWLISSGYTKPSKLAIEGGSNGGLLVGAAMVQRPDLFGAVLCSVPLLDMIRYHKFGYANIWADEYGSSENENEFRYLIKYSPYHNVKEGVKYPPALFVASENDARVDPMHAKKMAAALQNNGNKDNVILFDLLKSSGHGGGVGIKSQIRDFSRHYAFLMHFLGMD